MLQGEVPENQGKTPIIGHHLSPLQRFQPCGFLSTCAHALNSNLNSHMCEFILKNTIFKSDKMGQKA